MHARAGCGNRNSNRYSNRSSNRNSNRNNNRNSNRSKVMTLQRYACFILFLVRILCCAIDV